MTPDMTLQNTGFAAVIVILILREILPFVRKLFEAKQPAVQSGCNIPLHEWRQMYDWHARTDEEGVPVWYVRKSLERSLELIAGSLRELTELVKTQAEKNYGPSA